MKVGHRGGQGSFHRALSLRHHFACGQKTQNYDCLASHKTVNSDSLDDSVDVFFINVVGIDILHTRRDENRNSV
jgi:hypothetical protein